MRRRKLYTGMSFLHVLGRGVDGCGVSRYAIELHRWLLSVGARSRIVALDQRWTLSKWTHEEAGREDIQIKVVDAGGMAYALQAGDDCVLVHSMPPARGPKGSTGATRAIDEAAISAVINLVLSANVRGKRTAAVVLDHHPMSWHRNGEFWGLLSSVDVVLAHSDHGRLRRYMDDHGCSHTPIQQVALALDFTGCEEAWVRPAQQDRRIAFVGRYATFKDPGRMYKIRPLIPESAQVEVACAGIARVIESAWMRKHELYLEGEASVGKKDLETISHTHVKQLREHPRRWGLEYMRRSALCCDFYHLREDDYGWDTEYQILEGVLMGSVMVLDPHYIGNCRQHSNPSRLWEHSVGWPTASEEPTQAEADDLVDLLNHPTSRAGIRRRQLEFMRANHDAGVTFPRLLEEALEL